MLSGPRRALMIRFDYIQEEAALTAGDDVDAFFLPSDGGARGARGTTRQGHVAVQDHIQC